MSARALLDRLKELRPDDDVDWAQVREEIHDEFKRTITANERAMLLGMHKLMNDNIIRNLEAKASPQLESFRETAAKDYKLLVISECLIGQNVSTETLHEVTQREVAAGRMSADDKLYTHAMKAIDEPYLTRAELYTEEQERKAREEAATATPHPPSQTGLGKLVDWMRSRGKI